jgi:hypothetical protein
MRLIVVLYRSYQKKVSSTHLSVSPVVAPTTVNFSSFSPGVFRPFLRSRNNSNKFPSSCRATSLKANVGQWNNSSTNVLFFSFLRGVTCVTECVTKVTFVIQLPDMEGGPQVRTSTVVSYQSRPLRGRSCTKVGHARGQCLMSHPLDNNL